MIVAASKLLKLIQKLFRVNFDISGLAIFPFIFVANKNQNNFFVLINHEKIHFRQQVGLLFISFLFWYYIAMFRKGYRNISFEREAYENQENLNYLKTRKWFSFLKYQRK